MEWSLNVPIVHSAALRRCIPGGTSSKSTNLDLSSLWKSGDASFYSLIYTGLIPLSSRWSCRSLKTRMNSLSDLTFMEQIKMILLLYSYSTNRYLFSLFEDTGNLPVKSVAILFLWLMILVKTVLMRYASVFISWSSSFIESCQLVDLMFLLVWCVWTWLLPLMGVDVC